MGCSTNQIVNALSGDLHADVNSVQARATQSANDVVNHLAIAHSLLESSCRVSKCLLTFLNTSTIIGHVTVLVGREQGHFAEPLHALLSGQLVHEAILDVFTILQTELLNGSTLLDVVDEPEPCINEG